MAKQNMMLAKMELKYKLYYEQLFDNKISMLLQLGQDAACIAANEVLQLGKGRAETFCEAYKETVMEVVDKILADQMDDSEFIYAKSKIDERLKVIVGEDKFVPWEGRYKC